MPALLRRASEEKAGEDTVAYGGAIAKHIHKKGRAAFDRAVQIYNRDYGKSLSPDITPSPKTGRFRDRKMLAERTRLVQNVLNDNPHLTSRVLREMAKDEGYFNSMAHVAWSKAAEARTAGKISAAWWRNFDPYGGTAGNGPGIMLTGKHPGVLSKIAMAHDTDWSIGRHFGFGPLAKLRGAEGFTPKQLGQVGLVPDHPFGYFGGIDTYVNGHPDWQVKY